LSEDSLFVSGSEDLFASSPIFKKHGKGSSRIITLGIVNQLLKPFRLT